MKIIAAETETHFAHVRDLFREYAQELPCDLCFQGFEAELAGLPGRYAPPQGRLLLAFEDGMAAGCVALRSLEHGVCEMKRLYVRPQFRRRWLGRKLAEAVIAEAVGIGYERMRLDTLARLAAANALYHSLGFAETEPYAHNPITDAKYLELVLNASPNTDEV